MLAAAVVVATAHPLALPMGATLVAFVLLTYAIALRANAEIHDAEDFLVAGRRLPLGLAWATLMATWFGAGTMLTAADEIYAEGLRAAALEPLGSGVCLLLAGLFFARPLWEMRLLTLGDFYRERFGGRAEVASALLLIPVYLGWIAVQFLALAQMLHLFFLIPVPVGVLLVAVVGTGYTLMGGMWSVTLTDAVQLGLLIVGLCWLGLRVTGEIGGLGHLFASLPRADLTLIPRETAREAIGWLGVFVIASLGNLPGQDLFQRVFASKSAGVARGACLLAGGTYLLFGAIPALMGLAARLLLDGEQEAVVPALAGLILDPVTAVVFTVALMAAVLSTIDSALLSPASLLARNVIDREGTGEDAHLLAWTRRAVLAVAVASVVLALIGEDAYALLEDSYALGLVNLFVPLTLGLYWSRGGEWAALGSMVAGSVTWGVHYGLGREHWLGLELVPLELGATATALAVYVTVVALERDRR